MVDESDGINEVFEAGVRVALTAGGLMAERVARAREQQRRDAQAASEQEARELQARLDSERAAARASLAPVARDDWWDHVSAQDVGRAWETANAWKDIDADAQQAADRIREELRRRYDLDTDNLAADPDAVRDALERREHELREAVHEREKARLEEGEAALLLAGADRADRDREPRQADAAAERAAEIYDSAERRRELAASLDGRADAETIEARVVADTNQARPAHDAVANGPRRAPAAKRTRGKTGQVRSQPRRSERGR